MAKKGQAPRRIADSEKRKLLKRANELQSKHGYSLAAAAEEVGVGPSALRRWAQDGISGNSSTGGMGARVPDETRHKELAEFHKLIAGGMTRRDAADKVGRSASLLRQWQQKLDGSAQPLPTKPTKIGAPTGSKRARALVPIAFACPHCGGPVSLDGAVK